MRVPACVPISLRRARLCRRALAGFDLRGIEQHAWSSGCWFLKGPEMGFFLVTWAKGRGNQAILWRGSKPACWKLLVGPGGRRIYAERDPALDSFRKKQTEPSIYRGLSVDMLSAPPH